MIYKLNVFKSVNMQYFNRMRHLKDFFKCNHYRALPYIPVYPTYEDLKFFLSEDTELKDYFKKSTVSLSVHSAYTYNFFSQQYVGYSIEYFKKNLLLFEHMGVQKFLICNHLSYTNRVECFKILAYMLNTVPNLNKSFCLENCDHNADTKECLYFCKALGIPFIFDNLHNKINGKYNLDNLAESIVDTWEKFNYHTFIHYSNGDLLGKHSDLIIVGDLIDLIYAFKPYTDKLTVIIEVHNAKKALSKFREITKNRLDWSNWNSITL